QDQRDARERREDRHAHRSVAHGSSTLPPAGTDSAQARLDARTVGARGSRCHAAGSVMIAIQPAGGSRPMTTPSSSSRSPAMGLGAQAAGIVGIGICVALIVAVWLVHGAVSGAI